jgi:hypothetical protein
MGSTGGNTFGNYSTVGTSRCDESIDTSLEDVARLDFFKKNGKSLPPKGTSVRLRPSISATGRLIVEDSATSQAIGNLPTNFHHLIVCMERGHKYEGEVTRSRNSSIPIVEVHLDPA